MLPSPGARKRCFTALRGTVKAPFLLRYPALSCPTRGASASTAAHSTPPPCNRYGGAPPGCPGVYPPLRHDTRTDRSPLQAADKPGSEAFARNGSGTLRPAGAGTRTVRQAVDRDFGRPAATHHAHDCRLAAERYCAARRANLALDPDSIARVIDYIHSLHEATVLMVSHDARFIDSFDRKIYIGD